MYYDAILDRELDALRYVPPQEYPLRHAGIGASDTPAILGLTPPSWGRGPLTVYAEKIARPEPTPPSLPQKLGLLLEDDLLLLFLDRHVESPALAFSLCRTQCFSRHPELPVLSATFDAIDPNGEIIEIKTAGQDSEWGDEESGRIPDHYLVQCQHQMMVANRDAMWLVALVRGEYREYRVTRDQALCKEILFACAQFWRQVQRRDPPVFSSELPDPRVLALLHPATGRQVPASTSFQEALERYEMLGRAVRTLERRREEVRRTLLAWLAGDTAVMPDGRLVQSRTIRVPGHYVKDSEQIRLSIAKPKP